MRNYIIVSVILVCSIIFAQPKYQSTGRENIEIMKKWKLTEYLNLTEDQAEKFFPRLNELENQLKEIAEKRQEFNKILNDMADGNDANNKEMNKIINQIYDLEVEKLKIRKDHYKNIDDILTIEQKAKYLVFEKKFKKRMKNQFRERDGFKRGKGRERF